MSSTNKQLLTFQEATLADAAHLAHIINQGFRSERTGQTWLFDEQEKRVDIVSEDITSSMISADDTVMLQGFAGESEAVACCFVRAPSEPSPHHITPGSAWFGLLAVLPGNQGSGYGKAMLDEAEAFVQRKWNVNRLEMDYVNARIELAQWYRRCGYEPTGARRDFPYGESGSSILAPGLEMVVIGKDLS